MTYNEFTDPDSLKYLETPKYSLSKVFEINHSSAEVIKYTLDFHDRLIRELIRREFDFKAKTNIYGISYFCTSKKAFIFLGTFPKTMTLRFFTGGKWINGLLPGPWINKDDNLGSTPLQITSERVLQDALWIALESYEITLEWTRGK